jgi:hypothetical protein
MTLVFVCLSTAIAWSDQMIGDIASLRMVGPVCALAWAMAVVGALMRGR